MDIDSWHMYIDSTVTRFVRLRLFVGCLFVNHLVNLLDSGVVSNSCFVMRIAVTISFDIGRHGENRLGRGWVQVDGRERRLSPRRGLGDESFVVDWMISSTHIHAPASVLTDGDWPDTSFRTGRLLCEGLDRDCLIRLVTEDSPSIVRVRSVFVDIDIYISSRMDAYLDVIVASRTWWW